MGAGVYKDINNKIIKAGDTVKVKCLADSEYTHIGMVTYDEVGDGPDGLYVKGWCSVLGWDEMEVEIMETVKCKKCGNEYRPENLKEWELVKMFPDLEGYCEDCVDSLFLKVEQEVYNFISGIVCG